jgi:hypothetical protein
MGTCSLPPFSLFRLKSIHDVRKPQKSNSYRTIDANYAEILVSLAIKSHFTGSVRWYEAQESEVLSIIRHRGAPRRSLGNYKKTAIFEVPLYALLLIELPTPVYEDRISFPNQCGFSQFILRRKKGNKPSNITYGCANNLN